VTTFIEHLSGVDFEKRETVRIRNRYDASVPTVVAPWPAPPVFVEDAQYLRAQTDQPIKWTLPGPMTMIDTLYDAHYRSREKLAWEFARILNEEARGLEAAGVDIIQFDEPAFNVFFEEANDWGIAALERAVEGLHARPPSTSATATASRPTRTGRKRWGPNGASMSRHSPICKSPASISSRWNAIILMCQWI
jgi:5-methyltetrahydropteroyltriglutamate--homocysteine methyltransferase